LERGISGDTWVFAHPRLVRECREDLDEVRQMMDEGEVEIATEELRWLLGNCHEILEAHFLLGKIAVESSNDLALGRGHFGAGYQLGLTAWRRAGKPEPLHALHPSNRIFFDCGRGLAWCLHHLDKTELALEIVEQLLQFDKNDPLGLTSWLDEMKTAGKEMVSLDAMFKKA